MPGVSEATVIVTTRPFDGVALRVGVPRTAFSSTSVTVIFKEDSLKFPVERVARRVRSYSLLPPESARASKSGGDMNLIRAVTLSTKIIVKKDESRSGRIVIVEDSLTVIVAAFVEVDVFSAKVAVPELLKLGSK
jgi:hypothetical protein